MLAPFSIDGASSKSGAVQIARLQKQRAEIQQGERTEVIAKMKVAIAHCEVTAAELGFAGRAAKKAPKAKVKSETKAKAKAKAPAAQ